MIPAKYLYARVTIDAAAIERQAAADRDIERRMAAGGLSETRREKSRSRIRSWRFWTRCIEPELRGIIDDLCRRREAVCS